MLVVLRIVAYVADHSDRRLARRLPLQPGPTFLRFAWQVLKYGLVFAGVVLALVALERLAVL